MSKSVIYHNPRCQKSRETLTLLQEQKDDIQVVEYLKNPPDEKELKLILKKLKIKAADLIRKSEDLYKEKYKSKDFSDDEWIKIMVKNPILIERPIVVIGDKAIIGRPPENVLSII